VRFSKWHALGNAYLLIERADVGGELTADVARRLCDVHFGIGADGVVEVVRAEGSDAEVAVWNADGSTAEFSGNGARIAARWLAERAGADAVRMRVGERDVEARMRGGNVELDVGEVSVGQRDVFDLHGEPLDFTPVSVGNQHAVLRLDFDENDAEFYGPMFQEDERFPNGTNVQLVRVLGPRELLVAVWERGVGRTLSSGSSAVAAAAAAVANGWCESPVLVTFLRAGDVEVEIDEGLRARVTGPAEEICRGEFIVA
jgi:diaminopimelate epimerase